MPVVLLFTLMVMTLKRNGQERNKLHLTLSLGGSEAGYSTEAPPVHINNFFYCDIILNELLHGESKLSNLIAICYIIFTQ